MKEERKNFINVAKYFEQYNKSYDNDDAIDDNIIMFLVLQY